MIFDSHIYCFPAPDTSGGHPTTSVHLALWQRAYALHHQPAYRMRDRAPGDSRLLLDPHPAEPLRLATNRNFRLDHRSQRMVWTVDGEDYTKQLLPPNITEFSVGAAIAEMDYAGIDWALIHTDAMLTRDVTYIASCVKSAPDRLLAMAPIDELLIPTDADSAH